MYEPREFRKIQKSMSFGMSKVHFRSSCNEYECCDFRSFYPNILRMIGCRSLCSVVFSPTSSECSQFVDNEDMFCLFGFESIKDCGINDLHFQMSVQKVAKRRGCYGISNEECRLFGSRNFKCLPRVVFLMYGDVVKCDMSENNKLLSNASLGFMCSRGLEVRRGVSQIFVYAQILHAGRHIMFSILKNTVGIVSARTDGVCCRKIKGCTVRNNFSNSCNIPFKHFIVLENDRIRAVRNVYNPLEQFEVVYKRGSRDHFIYLRSL